jgi:spore coat protein U-like protein
VINDIDASSTISATCSNNVLYTIELDAGKGANATVASRKMSSNGNLVSYTMYTDAARTIIWGDGSAGTSVNSVRGTGSSQTIQVFGRIPKGQSPAIGAYTDTITLKLTF